MTTSLHAGAVWERLSLLSRRNRGPLLAAVPFFGTGATKLLNITWGAQLVLKFDREAIGAGLVNPAEVIKAINIGAKIYSCSNLHAKVYLFGRTAVVGSANVSNNSDQHLLEACIETTDRQVVANASRFIRGLVGDEIGLDYATKMLPFYRPPRRIAGSAKRPSSKRRLPIHSDLWLVSLAEKTWQEADYDEEDKGWNAAEAKLVSRKRFELETFQWSGGTLPDRYKTGQRALQCTKTNGAGVLVSPPGRIVSVRRYNVKNQRRAIVYVEVPKGVRRRKLKSVLRQLGPAAKKLGNPNRTKQIRSPEAIYALGRMWA